MIYLKKNMKFSLLILFFLFSCDVKQNFESDIRIPKVLKEYAKTQQNEVEINYKKEQK